MIGRHWSTVEQLTLVASTKHARQSTIARNLLDSGLDHEKTLAKMKLDSKPLTAAENYKILRDGWDAMNITNLYELNVAYVK
jgi:hypothetical protein